MNLLFRPKQFKGMKNRKVMRIRLKKKLEKITSGEKNKDDVLIAKCLEVVKEYLDREYNRS